MWLPSLLAFDLDDTLLNSAGELSEGTREAVRAAVGRGCRFAIVTGSLHHRAASYYAQLGVSGPIISYNGALLRESDNSRTYHHLPLSPEQALRVLAFADERHVHANVYVDDTLYVRATNPYSELYRTRHGSTALEYPRLEELAVHAPTKILLISEPEVIRRLREEAQAAFPDLYVTISKPEYLEFLNPNASKGKALRVLAEEVLGLRADQVAAAGDSYNDLDMLAYAGLGIAPANALPEVREQADYVCPSSDEDGAAVAIERILAGEVAPSRR